MSGEATTNSQRSVSRPIPSPI